MMEENGYQFDLPPHHRSIIKVLGVGGGGSNAVNHMYRLGIKDVEFVVCNTDSQALEASPVSGKLQIGINLTNGLGAGASPDTGREAALESKEDIRNLLSHDTRMVFITAGMGGGTGTGAAPVIAQVARELDILSVGIVTAPFTFEGKRKTELANTGIRELRKSCDTVLVIMNDKLREIYGKLSIREAFAKADNVLTTAAKGIAEIITVPGYINVDFEDVKTVIKNAGPAVMGSAKVTGENRARKAAEKALNSPLLNQQDIFSAEKMLLLIMSGEDAEIQMDELADITGYIQEHAGEEAEIIWGHGIDPELGENIRVTLIATGFGKVEENGEYVTKSGEKTQIGLESNRQISLFDLENEIKNDYNSIPEEEHEEGRSHEFNWLKKEIRQEVEAEDHEKPGEKEYPLEKKDPPEEEKIIVSKIPGDIARTKKQQFAAQRAAREAEFEGKKYEMPAEEFKERLEVPAYERRNIQLDKGPHSSENNISKFNLTEENKILGNNRFLHDNVD